MNRSFEKEQTNDDDLMRDEQRNLSEKTNDSSVKLQTERADQTLEESKSVN